MIANRRTMVVDDMSRRLDEMEAAIQAGNDTRDDTG